MAYTEADLARVRAEMLEAEAVTFGERSVKRRRMEELQALEAAILRELSQATRTRSKQTLLVGSTGF